MYSGGKDAGCRWRMLKLQTLSGAHGAELHVMSENKVSSDKGHNEGFLLSR